MKESRRDFLKRSGCAIGAVTLASQIQHFGAMSALAGNAEGSNLDGYKALVLVFLEGGNDGNNTVIPNHSNAHVSTYQNYADSRSSQGLAIPQSALLPITVPRIGLDYGLHPSLGPGAGPNDGIHPLWALGKMAIVTNVGTLVQPTTKAQYGDVNHPKPYQLFSHSDQIEQNQSAQSANRLFTGWGGRLNDVFTPDMGQTPVLPMLTSISGAQLFTAGNARKPLVIADSGTSLTDLFALDGIPYLTPGARGTAFNGLLNVDQNRQFIKAASEITKLAVQANVPFQQSSDTTVTFPYTGIGRQLRQAARLIKMARAPGNGLNISRQIFFCQLGGFDTHAYQGTTQGSLLSQFSQAVRAFYEETVLQGAQDEVTTFTMSDFGRTLNPTGTGVSAGTDHAWANHQFVIGGSVIGGNFYGFDTPNGTPYPTLTLSGPDDTDTRGRWIPTTANERYAAELAQWFGLSRHQDDLETVFPNLENFPIPRGSHDLSFMS